MSEHESHDGQSMFFRRWAEFVLKFRWLSLAVVLAITGLASYFIVTQLRVDHSIESFAPPNAPEIQTLHEFRDVFGRADPYIILVKGDVFTIPFLEKLKALQEAVKGIDIPVAPPPRLAGRADTKADAPTDDFDFAEDEEGWGEERGGSVIDRVTSLINIRQTRPTEDGIEVVKLFDPMPSAGELATLKEAVLSDSFYVGQVVDPVGQHAVITALPVDMYDGDIMRITDEVLRITDKFDSGDFQIFVTGPPAIASQINEMVIWDLTTLGAVSFVAVFIALVCLFRSSAGVAGPILVILTSVIWTLAFMALAGLTVNILTGILPAFLFCVGVCDSIHMLSIYRDRRTLGLDAHEAIVDAVGITGPPVFFTSLTTMTGLLSLNFASVTAISEMGTAGGVGVIIAWIVSLVLLPIFLSLTPQATMNARERGSQDTIDSIIAWCIAWSGERRKTSEAPEPAGESTAPAARYRPVLIGTAVIAAVMVFGVTQVQVFHDDLDMLPDETPVKVAVNKLDEHVGGVAVAELVVTPVKGTLKDVEIVAGLDRIIEDLKAYKDPNTGETLVTHAVSIVNVAKETRRAIQGGHRDAYRVPESQRETQDLLFLFENQSPEELKRLVTIDWTKSHVTLRVRWKESTAYVGFIKVIEDSVQRHLGGRIEVAGTGPVYVGSRLISVMLTDLSLSFATAFLFVSLFMIVMLRDLKLGLIAMLPNLFPIALVLGFIGLVGIPLDLNTLLIASIALGIAVDDTVHFLHHFQVELRQSRSCERALDVAAEHAGRAMVVTSALLIIGFLIYCFGTNAAIFRFGLLTALTVFAAVATDLLILPAFLRWLYPTRETSAGATQ